MVRMFQITALLLACLVSVPSIALAQTARVIRTAMNSGFRDVKEIRTDKDLNGLRDDPRIKDFLQLK
jgi:hypothetical protein